MLCTNCSIKIRPVVAIDIDGTLGDYHAHFQKFLEGYIAIDPVGKKPYDGRVSHSAWAYSEYGIDTKTFRDIKLAYRQGAQKRTMPAFEGASTFMRNVHNLDVELWITTTRPYMRVDNIDPDTQFWLWIHNIRYDGILYHNDKYSKLADFVYHNRVVAILDDLNENLVQARFTFGGHVPIKMNRVHNESKYWAGTSVDDFQEAYWEIQTRTNRWREING